MESKTLLAGSKVSRALWMPLIQALSCDFRLLRWRARDDGGLEARAYEMEELDIMRNPRRVPPLRRGNVHEGKSQPA